MPSFSPFLFLGSFPKPAPSEFVNTSTLDMAKKSIPFYWLLHKISFSVSWEAVFGSGESSEEYSDFFTVEYVINELPNEKICKEDNLITATSPNSASFTEGPTTDPIKYSPFFIIEPFQCEKLQAFFNVFAGGVALSTGFHFYLTSSPTINYGNNDQVYNIFFEEQSIDLPNGEQASLNAVVDFFDADYGEEVSPSATLTIDNVEWYEVQQ